MCNTLPALDFRRGFADCATNAPSVDDVITSFLGIWALSAARLLQQALPRADEFLDRTGYIFARIGAIEITVI